MTRIYMAMTVLAPLGGIESALLPLACELKNQGHEVIVWTIQPIAQPNQNADVLRQAGIEIITVPPTVGHWLARLQPHWLRLLETSVTIALLPLAIVIMLDAWRRGRSFAQSFAGARGKVFGKLAERFYFESFYYWHLGRLLAKRPADVVHLHGWGCGEDPPNAARWLRERNVPTVYTEHNSPDSRIHKSIANAPMNDNNVLIAVSQAGRAGLEQVGGATSPIHVIPYSVAGLPAPTQPPSDERPFTMLCFARLHPQKGQADLIRALPQVLAQIPDARLWLGGAGELRDELEALVDEVGVRNSAEFLGLITYTDLPNVLAQTDVVVLPSYWEGLPVSLIESLSAGKACVVTAVGGSPELIHDGVNGFVTQPHDIDGLAAALIKLGRQPQLRKQFEQASLERFATGEFSPVTVTNLTLKAYQAAIGNCHPQQNRNGINRTATTVPSII